MAKQTKLINFCVPFCICRFIKRAGGDDEDDEEDEELDEDDDRHDHDDKFDGGGGGGGGGNNRGAEELNKHELDEEADILSDSNQTGKPNRPNNKSATGNLSLFFALQVCWFLLPLK